MTDDNPQATGDGVRATDVRPATTKRRRRSRVRVLGTLLALVLVAGAVWTALEMRQLRSAQSADQASLDAGRTAAVAFTSYDHRHLDQDLRRVEELSTGAFRDQFTAALGTLTQAITKARGVSVGEVTYAGLRERTGDRAVVLAAVDATITNAASPRPSTRRYRLQITLNRDSGRWLIADITPVA